MIISDDTKSIMSFQFSQNLLADLQSQSPNSSHSLSLPATQQILPPSQNVSQPLALTSQSKTSLHSQNLLENQSQDYFPHPQNIRPRPKFPRSKSSQSLSHQQQPTIVGSRVPYSRFNQAPSPLNISLANSLKQVQRRLDDFPVQIAKMLEEGFDYLQTEARTGWLNLPILRVLLGDRGQRDRETRTGLQCTVEKSI